MIKLASDEQMKYIRSMIDQLGKPQPKYDDLPMYKATKIIEKLKDKLDKKQLELNL